MADMTPIQGELQTQIMATLWRLGSGSVEEVRSALPGRYRGAYTTVQTVLNRLAERGLLTRERDGRGMRYTPRISEADYLSRTIKTTLAGASADARHTALAQILGGLEADELTELQKAAQQARRARASSR